MGGRWWCATTGGHVGFESWLERDHVMLLDFDPQVVGVAAQPFWLSWPNEAGVPTSHAPDFFARRADGSALVIDCRPLERRRAQDMAKFAATGQVCDRLGWEYRLVAGLDPVLLGNLRWLSGYRHPRHDVPAVAASLLQAFATGDLLNRPPASAAELEQRWTEHGLPLPRSAGKDELVAVRGFLRAWRALVDAGTDEDRATVLNDLLRRYTERASVSHHEQTGWHLHFRDVDDGFAATLTGATTAAAAHFLTARGMRRFRVCARADCDNAFVDFTRPGTQRYCRHNCANRDAVRRHRIARRAQSGRLP